MENNEQTPAAGPWCYDTDCIQDDEEPLLVRVQSDFGSCLAVLSRSEFRNLGPDDEVTAYAKINTEGI